MEGFQWVRLGGIAALVLVAVYLLLPTIAGESADDRFREAAGGVEARPVAERAENDFVLEVESGDVSEIVAALSARFAATGLDMRGVEEDDGRIKVRVGYTTETAVAKSIAATKGEVAAYEATAFGDLPPEDAPTLTAGGHLVDAAERSATPQAEYWASALGGLYGEEATGAAQASVTSVTFDEAAQSVTVQTDPAVSPSSTPWVLTVDGSAVAAWFRDGTVLPLTVDGGSAAQLRAASAGALPGTVRIVEPRRLSLNAPEAQGADGEGAAAESGIELPDWLVGILPDTRIRLGLDLQGGIDVTLQVELDQAVLGQAARDALYLRDAAAKENLILESARRSPSEPIIEVVTDAPLDQVSNFMAKQLGDYQYFETEERTHRFEMRDERQEEVKNQAVEQVLETLRKRLDATGTKEPSIVKKGGGRINVQLPGATDVQAAVDLFVQSAVLEFRMVDHDFDDAQLHEFIDAAEAELPGAKFRDDQTLNAYLWDTKRLPPDTIIVWTEAGNVNEQFGRTWTRAFDEEGTALEASPYALVNEVPLTGNDVNDAQVSFDGTTNQAMVMLAFKPRGANVFCDLTGEAVGKRFAIILDNVVESAPTIRARICGGNASIEMGGAMDPLKESQHLATVLRTGALDASVVVASVRQVGASLGADSIRQGSLGAVVGALIVLVFMALWYRTSGLIADLALVVNVMMVLAALAATGATLTLPGIAGIALTVGMAVDANIIIYERIREELKLGIQPRKAVDVGFDKAVVAVLDANITTAIAGIVLFSYGTGPIKGFAVTLLIGIVTTLVSALFITRTVMDVVTRSSSARLRI